ncbi:MAG: phage major capsid protein [Candidatus Coproplasma sp.]
MKDFLNKLIANKQKAADELRKKIDAATDVNEARADYKTLEALNKEISDAMAELKKLDEQDDSNGNGGGDMAEGRSLNPLASYGMASAKTEARDADPLATMEYRKAFKDFVQNGVRSELLKRADAENVSSDLGILLPNTIVNEIIKGIEKVYGHLYSRVKKTNVKGGVQYPIGAFTATMYWDGTAGTDTEHGVSEKQKAGGVNDYVQFTYHIGEIRIAQSLLQSIVTVEAFEREIINALLEAYVKAMDEAILNGDGVKQPTGILVEAAKGASGRIPTANIITFSEADMADWKQWQKKLFAKIPLSMRKLRPEFVMTAETWESNILTLADDNNRPVGRETYNPETGDEKCTFKGRVVNLIEEGGIKSFDTAGVGDYFAMMWVPEKAYLINSNLQFSYKKYFDEDTNQWITKALVICDGKPLDAKYIFLLKKGA